jgi:hypothetical protein
MTNLITVNSTETLVKGQYKTDQYIYNVSYSHSQGKLISMNVQIQGQDNLYLGSANYGNSNNSVMVNDPSTLKEHADVIAQLYTEVLATIGSQQE